MLMTVVTVIGGQGLWALPKWIGDVITGDSWQGFQWD